MRADCFDVLYTYDMKAKHWTWRAKGYTGRAKKLEEVHGTGEFDEVVVSPWLHVELMSGGKKRQNYWARFGNRSFWFTVTKDGIKVVDFEDQDGDPVVEWPEGWNK